MRDWWTSPAAFIAFAIIMLIIAGAIVADMKDLVP